MANERFESVWDALCDTPEEAELMKEWSRQKMIDRAVEREAFRRAETPRSEYIKGDAVDGLLGEV